MPDTSDPYLFFDVSDECRVKLDTRTSTIVSWSPRRIPEERVLAAFKEREREHYYRWKAWEAGVRAMKKGTGDR